MFIDLNITKYHAPFGGSEVNYIFSTQVHSAPPNGAGGDSSHEL